MKLRSSEEIQAEYERWLKACSEQELICELQKMDTAEQEDAFFFPAVR